MVINFRIYSFLLLMLCSLSLTASNKGDKFSQLFSDVANIVNKENEQMFAHLNECIGTQLLQDLEVESIEDLKSLLTKISEEDVVIDFEVEDPSDESGPSKVFWALKAGKYVVLVSAATLVIYNVVKILGDDGGQESFEEKIQWINGNYTALLDAYSENYNVLLDTCMVLRDRIATLEQALINQTVDRTVEVVCRTPEVVSELYNIASEIFEKVGASGNSGVDLSYYLIQPINDAIAIAGQSAMANISSAINGMMSSYEGSIDYCTALMANNLTKIGELTSELIFKDVMSSQTSYLGVCNLSNGGRIYHSCKN